MLARVVADRRSLVDETPGIHVDDFGARLPRIVVSVEKARPAEQDFAQPLREQRQPRAVEEEQHPAGEEQVGVEELQVVVPEEDHGGPHDLPQRQVEEGPLHVAPGHAENGLLPQAFSALPFLAVPWERVVEAALAKQEAARKRAAESCGVKFSPTS